MLFLKVPFQLVNYKQNIFVILVIMLFYLPLIKIFISGTIQIQKRQQLVRKIHENELSDMKDYLSQCQQEQDSVIDYKVCITSKYEK